MSAATVAYDSLKRRLAQDSSTKLASLPNTLVNKSLKGLSSLPPGEKLHANASFASVSKPLSLKPLMTSSLSPMALDLCSKTALLSPKLMASVGARLGSPSPHEQPVSLVTLSLKPAGSRPMSKKAHMVIRHVDKS